MTFLGELKQTGKKSKKRLAGHRLVLHNQIFYRRRKKKLSEEFIKETGLDNSAIRNAVIRSLFQNYGLVVHHYHLVGSPSPAEFIPIAIPNIVSVFEEDGLVVIETDGEGSKLELHDLPKQPDSSDPTKSTDVDSNTEQGPSTELKLPSSIPNSGE